MIRKSLTLFLVIAVVASTVPVAAATSNPDIQTIVPQPTVSPGVENTVNFQLVNDPNGPENNAITATNVRVRVSDNAPINVLTERLYVSKLADGKPVMKTLRMQVPSDINSGTYRIPLTVTYEYESGTGDSKQITRSMGVSVRVQSGPRFTVTDTNSTATVDGRGTLTVTMRNTGQEAASDATFTLASNNNDIALGGGAKATRFVSNWEKGATKTFEYDARLGESAQPGNYSLEGTVAYKDASGNSKTSPSLTVGMRALPEMTFDVSDVQSSVRVADSGKIKGTITNTGPLTAHSAVVAFQSNSPTAQAVETEYAIGSLEPNESTSFSFTVSVDSKANPGPRQYGVQVNYRNGDGDPVQSDTVDLPVTVGESDAGFDIRNLESTLRVGEEGTLSGTLVNTDDDPVTNAVLRFNPAGQTITPVETEYAIGRLDPGEAREFSFDVEVSSSSSGGPRQFNFQVNYRDEDNQQRTTNPIEVRTDIGAKSDEFEVTPVSNAYAAGESGEFRVNVTNTREETLTDISAKIFPESPLSSSNSEAFIEELEPGESETIVFKLSASGDALAKTYPVKMDFQYEDSQGETTISDAYQVPVDVTESDGGGLPLGLIALVIVALGAIGFVYYRRQD
ncbi:s-layer domain-containing protein [Halogeometricum borinquense DSM 11551]|uniref:S-layer domain-containing protein n=1 Tax=Halogeometricum borinquense (strain ATCC 700274 / DSM 11551 / JCM 10706 / KCTC 4070 / PR3) TaxID=469382 RepID=E4NMY1_HALBP|nr:hypothetical protein [Halogeometricum borinquense]ADQ67393.1 S-layer domain-containing protein [Halogeometricum borinquense DSM 11551]ELY28605.1 s-layer domain-containing protein [Halogeometricum borinquense DSM 11551]